jgi:serine protease Do
MNFSMLGSARAVTSSLNVLAEGLQQSVVEVRSGESASATGIIWGGGGLVVTNAHCIQRGASVQVNAAGKWHEAHPLIYHPKHDLALLAAPSLTGPLLELRDPESLRTGELVFAHGHPLGIKDALAMGVLHAVNRDPFGSARWIVADVRLAPGNSGGPLVDAEGRLVGINSMVVNGLGVAVPASLVQRFVERSLSQRAA